MHVLFTAIPFTGSAEGIAVSSLFCYAVFNDLMDALCKVANASIVLPLCGYSQADRGFSG